VNDFEDVHKSYLNFTFRIKVAKLFHASSPFFFSEGIFSDSNLELAFSFFD